MTRDDIKKELHENLEELHETIQQHLAVQSFIEQSLLSEDDAVDDGIRLSEMLLENMAELNELIARFLETSTSDREMVDKAQKLVSKARAELVRFQENNGLKKTGNAAKRTDIVH